MIDLATYREAFAEIHALNDEGVAFFGPSFGPEGSIFDATKLQVEVLGDRAGIPKVIFRVTRWFGDSLCRWTCARLAADTDYRLPTLKQAVAMQRLPTTAFPEPGSVCVYRDVVCTVTWTAMSTLMLTGLGLCVEVPLHQFLIEQGRLEAP